MPGPHIEPGRIEQGIYTWSSLDVEGKKGQWFGALSPGLSESLRWLRSLDFGSFQPLDDTLGGNYGYAYSGWEKQVTVGAFPLGDFSFVYRLIPKAGTDATGRDRFVAHVLVGRREELGLCSVADDDPHWLEAGDCQLDRLPALTPLELAELKPFRPSKGEEVEKTALDLLETWKGAGDGLTCNLPATADVGRLTTALLTLVPTPLWNSIDLDWRIGVEGPIAYIRIHKDAATPSFRGAPAVEGLSDRPFHEDADRDWENRGPRGRSWPSYVGSFAPPSGGPPAAEVAEPKPPPPETKDSAHETKARSVPGNPRTQLLAQIGADLGSPAWHEGDGLNEEQALRAVRTIEKSPPPPGGWLATLEPADFHHLFANVEDNGAIGKIKRTFKTAEMPLSGLVRIWEETGLAVVGASLLDHDQKALQRHDSWALPKRLDEKQLKNLLAYLGNTQENGYAKIALLLQSGFATSREGREAIAKATIDAGVPSRRLFEDILPQADLAPADLLEFIRENLSLFTQWLPLPEQYAAALRLSLRQGFWHRLKDHF